MQGKMKVRTYEGGQAMIVAVVLFLAGMLILLGGIAVPVLAEIRMVNDLVQSKQSLFIAEGALEDAAFRLKEGMDFTSPEVLSIGGGTATVTTQIILDQTQVTAVGDRNDRIRKMRILLNEGFGAAFNYGMQADVGGIIMENNSSIAGNAYSNGPINGANSNLIRGEAISAGPDGLIDGLHATGSAFAHTIQNSDVDRDAYYVNLINTNVGGEPHPGSPDQATTSLPIPDSQITLWEEEAEAGGVISSPCPYVIDSSATLGPVKITCDVTVDKNSTVLTVAGPIWVEGNFNTKSGPTIRAAAALGKKSVPIIADNSSNRLTSSKAILQNNAVFEGSGDEQSYILLISQNESAEQGGGEIAISVENSVSGDLLVYAGHGEIRLANSVNLKEVSGWRLRLQNFAEVTYESGLASLLFTAGPTGGFEINDWREVE